MKKGRRCLAVVLVLLLTLSCGLIPASAEGEITTERQTYHYTPASGWASDPNGLVYFNGEWHMFFQHTINSTVSGRMVWGHATSKDLLYWEHQPVAIFSDELGAIFSGSAVVDVNNSSGLFEDGKPGIVAFFTHNGKSQQQSVAYSQDGKAWTKYEGNPIIPSSMDPLRSGDFRDPKVFWHEGSQQWMMIVAGGPVRFFSSDNLLDWRAEGTNPEIRTECPDMFEMTIEGTDETRWVFNEGGRYYRVGDFKLVDGKWKFVEDPDNTGRQVLNFGNDAYAAQTFNQAPDGRLVMLQWLSNWEYADKLAYAVKGYNGTYTLATELSLVRTADGLRLRQFPAKEYETLRDTAGKKELTATLTPNGDNPLADWSGTHYELQVEFTPSADVTEVGLHLRTGDGRAFQLGYDLATQEIFFDRRGAGGEPRPFDGALERYDQVFSGKMAVGADRKVKWQIFVDSTSVEVYAQDGLTVGSSLVFPDVEQAGMDVYAQGGTAEVKVTMYPMNAPTEPQVPDTSTPASTPDSSTAASAPAVESGGGTASDAALPGWGVPVIAVAAVVVVGGAVVVILVIRRKKSA